MGDCPYMFHPYPMLPCGYFPEFQHMYTIHSHSLFMQLVRGSFSNNDNFSSMKNRVKFALRSSLALRPTLRWLGFLSEHTELLELLRENPRLAMKPHRPYLTKSMSIKERVGILMSHYRLTKRLLHDRLYRQLLTGHTVPLAKLTGKDGKPYTISLTRYLKFDREGELSLLFTDQDRTRLAIITFVLYEYKGVPAILIAGLQGPDVGCPHDVIKHATKDFHGIFPKKLAMEALMTLSNMLGITHIHAISKEAHIYNLWRYRDRLKQFGADYNPFWKELGGTPINDDLYQLPNAIYHKPIELVESKKRAEHRRRHAMIAEMRAQIHKLAA
jgi:uncharacterized protein VirK/YbjX